MITGYYAFSYNVGTDKKTFGLFPLSTSSSMEFGFWNTETNELVLESKDKRQELQLFEKMDQFGEPELKAGKKLIERRLMNPSFQFRINKEEVVAFIETNVVNKDLALSFINQ